MENIFLTIVGILAIILVLAVAGAAVHYGGSSFDSKKQKNKSKFNIEID